MSPGELVPPGECVIAETPELLEGLRPGNPPRKHEVREVFLLARPLKEKILERLLGDAVRIRKRSINVKDYVLKP